MEALDIEISPFEYDPARDFSIRRNDISVKLSGVPESFEDYFRMKAKDTTYPEPSFFVNVASEHIGIIRGERGKLVDELRRILLGEFYGKEVPILVMVKPEPESVQRIKPKLRLSSSHA